jgi:tRNA (cmo5U34)-methyltransferase
MRDCVHSLVKEFAQTDTDFLDLGSSRGAMVDGLIEEFGPLMTWTLTEVSPPMLVVLKEKFDKWVQLGRMKIVSKDITENFPSVGASVVTSIFTVQFTPIEYRQKLIQNVYNSLLPSGVFIFVEKILGSNAEIDELMVSQYYKLKSGNGYTQDEIERKRMQLRGVLFPVTAKWNEELLAQAGFKKIDCFWRWMNFAGWIAIK